MKRFFIFCLMITTIFSCSLGDDDYIEYNFEFLPIESVEIPSSFTLGETYEIGVSYYRPSTCHYFHDFYFLAEGFERTIAIIDIVYNNDDCNALTDQLVERTFTFHVSYDQTYVFKFWQGEDENGEDVYLTYEIPVVE